MKSYRDLRSCPCGTLLSFPWESEQAYSDWYASDGYHYQQQADEGFPDTAARDSEHQRAAVCRIRVMESLGLSGPLLDVGAAMGALVGVASGYGWDALGVEPCAAIVRQAQKLGRNVITGSATELPDERFPVITCLDVLEHLTRPATALLAMKERLRPGGCLIVEMPEAYAPGGDWRRHIRPRQHVCLYDDQSALELFGRCGFALEAQIRPLRGELAKAAYYLRAK